VFVLDMGEPVRILDMACDLIKLSGLEPYQDIDIQFTGIRPGEKLYEELLTAEEGTSTTRHAKIYQANLRSVNEVTLQSDLLLLKQAMLRPEIIDILADLVPSYREGGRQEAPASKEVSIGGTVDERNERLAVPVTLH
jgi:FlaA1/EpsC-like NDP-sugar epimerase